MSKINIKLNSEEVYLLFKKIQEIFIKKNKSDEKEKIDEITEGKNLPRASLSSDIINNNSNNNNININTFKKKFLLNIFQ